MKIGRNDFCWCGSGLKYKKCHSCFDSKMDTFRKKGCFVPPRTLLKSSVQIEGIKKSAEINIAVLDYIAKNIRPGISTSQIDQWVYEQTRSMGAMPATLDYDGFPNSVCTSINDEVCHGIPSPDVFLRVGDIINVDVSTVFKGYFSDSSRMFCIGDVSEDKKQLVQIAKECVYVGLRQVKPWGFLGDLGQAIQDYAKSHGYTVVKEIGGHGIGLEFHEDPWVSYVSKKGTGMMMVPGMIFTIEPMINMGADEIFIEEENGWTVNTMDGLPSAQWEIQVLVTDTGWEVLAY